jgi:hypothetical protein
LLSKNFHHEWKNSNASGKITILIKKIPLEMEFF